MPNLTSLRNRRAVFRNAACLAGWSDHDVFDTGQHEGTERVLEHRFVVNGEQLLGDGKGNRVEARAQAACEDNAFSGIHASAP